MAQTDLSPHSAKHLVEDKFHQSPVGLNELISNMLEMARLGAGTFSAGFKPLDSSFVKESTTWRR